VRVSLVHVDRCAYAAQNPGVGGADSSQVNHDMGYLQDDHDSQKEVSQEEKGRTAVRNMRSCGRHEKQSVALIKN
jgi:hypothetical protein